MIDIRFKFAADKSKAALHWMVAQGRSVDLHTALKACYFADRDHLNRHHRPVFGATYRAMRFGPVPLEIYEMAKGEALWLAELGLERLPWRLEGFRLRVIDNDDPDLSPLASTDFECLREGFDRSRSMSFSERTAATHDEDWQAARLGLMRYEDMLDDVPEKPDVVVYLQENARFMRL